MILAKLSVANLSAAFANCDSMQIIRSPLIARDVTAGGNGARRGLDHLLLAPLPPGVRAFEELLSD